MATAHCIRMNAVRCHASAMLCLCFSQEFFNVARMGYRHGQCKLGGRPVCWSCCVHSPATTALPCWIMKCTCSVSKAEPTVGKLSLGICSATYHLHCVGALAISEAKLNAMLLYQNQTKVSSQFYSSIGHLTLIPRATQLVWPSPVTIRSTS